MDIIKTIKRYKKIIFMVFILDFLISVFSIGCGVIKKNKRIVNNPFTVAAFNKAGNISFSENEFYEKYNIICKNDMGSVNWKNKEKYILITLNLKDIEDIKTSYKKNGTNKNISFQKTKDGYMMLRINKKYNENNYIDIDSSNKKIINVYVSKKKKPYNYVIVIDPGHGGYDKGTSFGTLYEKDITLKISKDIKNLMEFNGYKIVLTRDGDTCCGNSNNSKEDLKNRVQISKNSKADIFVSIHINSFKDSKYKGITTYYYEKDGQTDKREKLARDIQNSIIKSGTWHDRGIAIGNFNVLRNTDMLSVLVECGFLTNSEDRKKLQDDDALNNIALDISNGIKNYLSEKT